jgi:sodium/bile acid cotransporter 7
LKTFLVRNWFVLALPVSVLLAWVAPGLGAQGGFLRSEITTKFGVALIFLLQGLTLPSAALRRGAGRWRLHLLVQSFTFLLFPLLGIGLDWLVGRHLPPDLRLGFLFLCVLPSTVSTSVVLTTLAGGNTVGAIFNAALSNILGVFVTPLWVAWLIEKGGQPLSLTGVIREIFVLLLLPLAVGQGLRLALVTWADAHKKAIGNSCSVLILFIVFAAFCNSVQAGFWRQHSNALILGTAAGVAAILALALGAVEALSRVAGLDRGDRIAASFCAPQKTIASGIPLAKALFGAHPGLGFILLPLLFYHPLQLIVCGILADRFARAGKDAPLKAGSQSGS